MVLLGTAVNISAIEVAPYPKVVHYRHTQITPSGVVKSGRYLTEYDEMPKQQNNQQVKQPVPKQPVPKQVVSGYFIKDGIVPNQVAPPLIPQLVQPTGMIYVKGYFRKDGTYVNGYYRRP
jgi:hypothetical protein